jgi:predicted nucleotidyltransferase
MGSQGAAHSDVDVLIDPNPAAGFDLIDVVGVKNVLSD